MSFKERSFSQYWRSGYITANYLTRGIERTQLQGWLKCWTILISGYETQILPCPKNQFFLFFFLFLPRWETETNFQPNFNHFTIFRSGRLSSLNIFTLAKQTDIFSTKKKSSKTSINIHFSCPSDLICLTRQFLENQCIVFLFLNIILITTKFSFSLSLCYLSSESLIMSSYISVPLLSSAFCLSQIHFQLR